MNQPNVLYVATKALIKNEDGKILVLQQSDSTISGGNRYHPPGGVIELGETLQECLAREVREEIGVESTVGELFDVGEWRAERGDTVMQFVGLFYICHIKNTDFTFQESEVASARWIGADEIDLVDIVEPSRSIIKKFLRA